MFAVCLQESAEVRAGRRELKRRRLGDKSTFDHRRMDRVFAIAARRDESRAERRPVSDSVAEVARR